MQSQKTTSLSSPSIKSESDINSPSQQQQGSPLGATQLVGGFNDDYSADIGNNISGAAEPTDDPSWAYEPEDLDINDLPIVLRAMVGLGMLKRRVIFSLLKVKLY